MTLIQTVLIIALCAYFFRFSILLLRRSKYWKHASTPVNAQTSKLKIPLAAGTQNSAPPWPSGIPQLYPGLTPHQLCHFLSKEEYERIRSIRRIIITPFYDDNSNEEEKYFGIGLQTLLIRDLRLHPDISVLGPEDSPAISLSELDLDSDFENAILIGGTCRFEDNRFRGYFKVVERDDNMPLQVEDEDFHRFILESCRGLLSVLRLEANATLLKYWQTGRPTNPRELVTLGQLQDIPTSVIDQKNSPRTVRVMELFRSNPNFVLPLHTVEDETEIHADDYLQAFARDPYDVQLQFLMSNKFWTGKKSELAAFQYARRAIELCPGHGKAHMVLNNPAPPDADLYYHSELGYLLLPGNSFAVSNHLLYLLRKRLIPADLSIAYKGVKLDPCNILPYWQGIELLKQANHLSEAMGLALQLKKVVTPPLSERTIYCIHQNPRIAAAWKAGTYDPLKQVEEEIASLEAKLSATDPEA